MPKSKRLAHNKKRIPKKIEELLEENKDADIGDALEDCALTEDECDAMGIDFTSHNMKLIDRYC